MKNYFNYFTEIEEHFVRKRGKNILVSPLDWCLIEVWKEQQIPLQVVLRGIDRSFEAALRRQKKAPATLFYCHPGIMEAYQEYCAAMVGSREEETGTEQTVEQPRLLEHLEQLIQKLRKADQPACARALARLEELYEEARRREQLDPGELEQELSDIQGVLAIGLEERLEPERLDALRAEVKAETKIYKKHLAKEMYERLKQGYLQKKLLAEFGLPEFTLLQ
ncbi:MAG: hypothetical protein EHM23_18860 [Acidobacteria bacterium]|nr:MAG: hypothetical protein EHM23_18860 [Acidobacteriota bacterium]